MNHFNNKITLHIKKYVKIVIGIFISLMVLLVISTRFTLLNIYDNNVLCFEYKHYNEVETEPGILYAEYKSVYTIFPYKINTNFGDIYIGHFSNVELRGEDYGIYYIELTASKNKLNYNLEIFGNNIENVERLQIGRYGLAIDLAQEFIFDGLKKNVVFICYNEIDNFIFFVTSEYKYIYLTLEGEIMRK